MEEAGGNCTLEAATNRLGHQPVCTATRRKHCTAACLRHGAGMHHEESRQSRQSSAWRGAL